MDCHAYACNDDNKELKNFDNNVALAHCVNGSEIAHKGLKPLVVKKIEICHYEALEMPRLKPAVGE